MKFETNGKAYFKVINQETQQETYSTTDELTIYKRFSEALTTRYIFKGACERITRQKDYLYDMAIYKCSVSNGKYLYVFYINE